MKTVLFATLALAAIAYPNKEPDLPNQFLQAELVAELNGMVDIYRRIPSIQLSQNLKELKVRKVNVLSVDQQFMYVKIDVRIREKNGMTGYVLYTSDGSAKGKFRWGPVTAEKACLTAGFQEFSCLTVTSIADVPHVGGQEVDGAKRTIQANFPREVCALMWPTITVTGSIFPEKTEAAHKHPSRTNNLIFNVALSNHSARNVKVKYGTQDGTAKAGIDYKPANGELLIPAGTKIMRIVVPIIPRDGNQGARQMLMNLWSPVNGKIADNQAVGVILDTGQSVPGGAVPPP